jgi:hypothetical protein
MDSRARIAERYVDQVKLSLAGQRYLTEPQERALLLEGLDIGLSLDDARRLLAETVAIRRAARETTLDRDMAVTIGTFAGDKGWISRTNFDHAANLYRRLSGGAVSAAEAKSLVKQMMLRHGRKIRGEIVFGTPHWYCTIPVPSTGAKISH